MGQFSAEIPKLQGQLSAEINTGCFGIAPRSSCGAQRIILHTASLSVFRGVQLPPELRRIGHSEFRHLRHLRLKPRGVHQTGSTPTPLAIGHRGGPRVWGVSRQPNPTQVHRGGRLTADRLLHHFSGHDPERNADLLNNRARDREADGPARGDPFYGQASPSGPVRSRRGSGSTGSQRVFRSMDC